MSYFEDQMEAWEDSGFQGRPEDMNPDEFWADRVSECEKKGHGEVEYEILEKEDGSKKPEKVCQKCKAIL